MTHVRGPESGNTGRRGTILLADDQAMIRRLGQGVLERHGYRVLLAADGDEALAVYREQAGEIDLVILDVYMPRMSGQETLQALRRLNPAVRVLFVSGCSGQGSVEDVGVEGTAGFIVKPFQADELLQAVRTALDHDRPGRASP